MTNGKWKGKTTASGFSEFILRTMRELYGKDYIPDNSDFLVVARAVYEEPCPPCLAGEWYWTGG